MLPFQIGRDRDFPLDFAAGLDLLDFRRAMKTLCRSRSRRGLSQADVPRGHNLMAVGMCRRRSYFGLRIAGSTGLLFLWFDLYGHALRLAQRTCCPVFFLIALAPASCHR